MSFVDFKSLASALESIAKIVALVIAGWWTFVLFVQKREKYPRSRTTHSLVRLGEVDGYRLLRLAVKIENLGNVLIELRRGKVSIQVVRPLLEAWKGKILHGEAISRVDGREFPWPDLEEFPFDWGESGYRIEPLESEEFHFDLVLASTIEAVQVYSYFNNITEKNKELGWNCTTIQTIPIGEKSGEQTANSARPQAAAGFPEAFQFPRTAQGPNQTGATEADPAKEGR